MLLAALLYWYFTIFTPSASAGKVVGPFLDQAWCDAIRTEMKNEGISRTSKCWPSSK